MLSFALNHMSVPALPCDALLALAARLGCVGVELRNDLARPLFDGLPPATVRARASELGLRIVGLSQVYPFNTWSDRVRDEVEALIGHALACGAETISLIPRNDGQGIGEGERQGNLRLALRAIKPLLEQHGMVALVEPLGFDTSSLRAKSEAVDMIQSLNAAGCFKLVHDTFHHHLAGGGAAFPDHTGIVHVSGVIDRNLAIPEMRDEHRVLVDGEDRLGNIAQIAELCAAGYAGPISFEAFSPVVHALPDPEAALSQSIAFIKRGVAALRP